jgi:hypothetical protein
MRITAVYETGSSSSRNPSTSKSTLNVEVSIPAEVPLDAADPTGWKAAEALAGFIEDAPSDVAEHHHAYLSARRR